MNPSPEILITGGAGYIGSHTVRHLLAQGAKPVVIDNLVFGHPEAIAPEVPLYRGDVGDSGLLNRVFEKHRIEAIIHFAAYAYVGESVQSPLKYYENNLAQTLSLLRSAVAAGCKRFIFSSTCATYGHPASLPLSEATPQSPLNPYGHSKLMVEQVLRDCETAHGLQWVALRYFNAAGSTPDGSIGEDHDPETHLIPNAFRAVQGELPHLTVFGDDYPTPDGSCVRDYIHVVDLASAHWLAFLHLESGGASLACNLGTGRGTSVKEVIQAVASVTGKTVPLKLEARRPGDPPELVADASLARQNLGWKPVYEEIRPIIETAWTWFNGPSNGRFPRT